MEGKDEAFGMVDIERIVKVAFNQKYKPGYHTESIEVNLTPGVNSFAFTLSNEFLNTVSFAIAKVANVPDNARIGIRVNKELVIDRTSIAVFDTAMQPVYDWKPVDLPINKEIFIEIEVENAVTGFKLDTIFLLEKKA